MYVTPKCGNRRGMSPVIATVILVAVAITVAVAVAYWMSGIAGQYTKFEKIEIQSAYAIKFEVIEPLTPFDPRIKGWNTTIQIQNTGSAPATLVSCFINDVPLEGYPTYPTNLQSITWQFLDETQTPAKKLPIPLDGLTIESGGKETIYVSIVGYYWVSGTPGYWEDTGITFTSGTTVNVILHSAGGMDYVRLVELP